MAGIPNLLDMEIRVPSEDLKAKISSRSAQTSQLTEGRPITMDWVPKLHENIVKQRTDPTVDGWITRWHTDKRSLWAANGINSKPDVISTLPMETIKNPSNMIEILASMEKNGLSIQDLRTRMIGMMGQNNRNQLLATPHDLPEPRSQNQMRNLMGAGDLPPPSDFPQGLSGLPLPEPQYLPKPPTYEAPPPNPTELAPFLANLAPKPAPVPVPAPKPEPVVVVKEKTPPPAAEIPHQFRCRIISDTRNDSSSSSDSESGGMKIRYRPKVNKALDPRSKIGHKSSKKSKRKHDRDRESQREKEKFKTMYYDDDEQIILVPLTKQVKNLSDPRTPKWNSPEHDNKMMELENWKGKIPSFYLDSTSIRERVNNFVNKLKIARFQKDQKQKVQDQSSDQYDRHNHNHSSNHGSNSSSYQNPHSSSGYDHQQAVKNMHQILSESSSSKRIRIDDFSAADDKRPFSDDTADDHREAGRQSTRSNLLNYSLPDIKLPEAPKIEPRPVRNSRDPRVRDPRIKVKKESTGFDGELPSVSSSVDRRDPRAGNVYLNRKNKAPAVAQPQPGQKRKMTLQDYLSVKSEPEEPEKPEPKAPSPEPERSTSDVPSFNFRPFGS